MPILNMQRRSRELGRIRLGHVVRDAKGKLRPEKLARFRITSASQPLLEKVAVLYGGTVQPWTPQGGGPEQWEVLIEATRIPVLVPPRPVSQYYELWSGGGCVRRCDGQTELLSGGQCVCGVDPDDRECKPTTRLNVVLRDVEGIGVFRVETHGFYAATELPEVAEFLARAGGYVAAHLGLEERVVKREGKTRRFMVPTIEVDVTPAQLLGGAVPAVQLGAGPAAPALPVSPSAFELDPTGLIGEAAYHAQLADARPPLDVESVRAAIAVAQTVADLFAMKDQIVEAGLGPLARERQHAIERAAQEKAAQATGDPDELWASIMAAVPAEWSTARVEDDFARVTGVDSGAADAQHMTAYLAHLAKEPS